MASSCSSGILPGAGSSPTGVKQLVDGGIFHVPAQYVMPEQQRVGASPVVEEGEEYKIPVVDVTSLLQE
eukprot:c921_g1_i1 orf=3-206(-)